MNYFEQIKRFKKLRSSIGTIKASNYDITSFCNLTCEGCLYFEGSDYLGHKETNSLDKWADFFQAEVNRGVNFVYIAGAEPSFVIDRIRIAHEKINKGVVFTNGTKFIPKDISYRIHVSIWGVEDDVELRGKSVLKKALKNYAGDKRVVFTFTINKKNINQILKAIELCYQHQVKITFSFFSPTSDYLSKIKGGVVSSGDKFFRISTSEDNLILDDSDFLLAREYIKKAMQQYPNTVIYSLFLHDYISSHFYQLDANGIALDCGSILSKDFRHYAVDMSVSKGKCCLPNLDCSHCKAYTQMFATYLKKTPNFKSSEFSNWLDSWELWSELFL